MTMKRREFLRLGLGGFASLGLGDLYRLQARSGDSSAGDKPALIVVWLQGGASHLETYDPKPDAPAEIRGPFASLATSVPAIRISELLPLQARLAHHFTLVRSLVHTGFCHQQGNQQLFTGDPVLSLKLEPDHPDLFAVLSQRHPHALGRRILPFHVGLNPIPYVGPAYLGPGFGPFSVYGDPNTPTFEVPDIRVRDPGGLPRLDERMRLVRGLDEARRAVDGTASTQAHDAFQQRAWNLIRSPEAARAFNLDLEDSRRRDRYGRNTWGQRLLLARRLVEAGVDIVTTSLDGPLCGRVGNWDDHAVNHHIFEAMRSRCQYFDRGVSALIEDLIQRGLDRRVLVMVTGEFGRTPRINYQPDSASNVTQPGRDHWPRATSLLFFGGGVRRGLVLGGTDRHGGDVVSGRVGVRDLLASVYHHFGIDAGRTHLQDRSGRPIPLLPEGQLVPELTH